MGLENKIKDFVLLFFKISEFKINCENEIYFVDIPEKNQNYFQKSRIIFTFDEITANENNCELIIPGSKTLFQIINLCNNKGPVIKKDYPNSNGYYVIRYHFFVYFSGISNSSQLFTIDVDLEKLKILNVNDALEPRISTFSSELFSKNITKSYLLSLEELKNQSTTLKNNFLNSCNDAFQLDYNLFVQRYDDEISEYDKSIYEKEKNFSDLEKIKKYRFDTLDKIKNLETIKDEMIINLQKKHKLSLDYNLIGSEILLI
jgi:hypothetical protein